MIITEVINYFPSCPSGKAYPTLKAAKLLKCTSVPRKVAKT